MSLQAYRSKRDFGKTSEPPDKSGKPHRKPIFVVQEHHASRLHYDFRLEADGVLKSWAVPKQPSMDPAQKRLAVHVEDHPLDYAKFEGTIPKGQYGAGIVEIWDRGTYDNLLADKPTPQSLSEGIDSGHVEFELHGRKLKGQFALIRMRGRGKDNWLLIKMKDELARPDGPIHNNGRSPRSKLPAKAKVDESSEPKQFEFSHLDKVMYPDVGLTKGDVIDYYRRIAPRLLPYLRDRPATLERLPDGVNDGKAPHFWQKNLPASYPDWIPRVELPTERGKPVHYPVINNLETLLYLVNQGTLTFHIWFSRIESLDQPDFVLFDLDPGRASFADAVVIANELHSQLNQEHVKSFVKTSGKTGLHIFVPWGQSGGYDEARAWALSIAERVAGSLPSQATTERSKAKRGERVYIDVMQNARGHHAVPPFVLRAIPRATVSTPLQWRQVTKGLDPADFTTEVVLKRFTSQKSDPMAKLLAGLPTSKRKAKSHQRA